MSVELLSGGVDSATENRAQLARRWARRHRLALLAAGFLVLLGVAGDQWQQQRELDQLLGSMQSGEQQIGTTERYFDGVVAYYSPVIFRASPPPGLHDGFQTDINEGTGAGLDGIAETSSSLDAVRVLPWHRDVRTARAAYQDRIAQWQQYLARVSADADVLFKPTDGFDDSLQVTKDALSLAIPWSGPGSTRDRIQEALDDNGR